MEDNSTFFTVTTVTGSASTISIFCPSRLLTVNVWPDSPTIVPRMRVGGAVCAMADPATQSASAAAASDLNIKIVLLRFWYGLR